MNRFTNLAALFNSTAAARIVTIVLLATLAGLLTDAFLTLGYGEPAPAALDATSAQQLLATPASKPVPTWLQGGLNQSGSVASDIKLLGVVAQGDTGYALIQSAGKRAQFLLVGQTLADGTQLVSVKGKTATLSVGGVSRNLSLETTGGAVAINNAAPIRPTAQMDGGQAPHSMDASSSAHMSAQIAQQTAQMQQAQILQAQQLQGAAQGNIETSAPNMENGFSPQMRRRMGRGP